MSLVRKHIEIESRLVEKIQLHYGEKTSLTPIINELLSALVEHLEVNKINFPSIYSKAAKIGKENYEVSRSTEVPTENL